MSLISTTITATQPAAIVAGENPIIVNLSTGAIGAPAYSKGRFSVLSTSTNNLTLTFSLPAYTKVFTGKQYPNRDDYFLTSILKDTNGLTIDSGITTTMIASSLADCFKKDIVISKNYYINYSGGTIVDLQAKVASTQLDLTGRVVSSNGGNLSFSASAPGADAYQGSKIPDYSLYIEVYKGDDSIQLGEGYNVANFQRVTECVLPYSTDNIHRFDLSTICKNFVNSTRPNLEQQGCTTSQNSTSKFILPFVFYWGSQYPLVAGSNTSKKLQQGRTTQIWVGNSSLPFVRANTLTSYTGLTNNVKFLTNSPTVKHSNRDQREVLSLLIPKNLGRGLCVKADITYWDGTKSTGETLFNLFPSVVNYGGLYNLNVSHEFVFKSFETLTGKKIKLTSVSVNDSTGKYSVTQKYSYPFENPSTRFGVCFLNSLGTWDTVDFIGYGESAVDRTKKNLSVPVLPNQDGSFPQGFKYSANYDVAVTKRVTVNSGWINQSHFDWLIELLKSNEIYQYQTSTVNFLKLDSFKYLKGSEADQFNIEVTFIQTIFENNVSV